MRNYWPKFTTWYRLALKLNDALSLVSIQKFVCGVRKLNFRSGQKVQLFDSSLGFTDRLLWPLKAMGF